MKTKVASPELTLIELFPRLRGSVHEGGWVTLHKESFNSQRTSLEALTYLSNLGYNFDIETNDKNVLYDTSIVDARIRLEYNVNNSIETLPPNGIACWRLSSLSSREAKLQYIPEIPLKKEVKLFEQPVKGPHYANDKYKREIKPGVMVDVYDVIECYEVTSGALQHALKKILAAGKRGHKDYEQDLIDILSSVERALFQHQEKHK